MGVIETGDDTPHPIEHIGDIPLTHVGQKGIMRYFLHVLTITKSLVLVDQIVDQCMKVWFTHHECYIKEEGKIITQGRCVRRMFILQTIDVGTTMFAKGQKIELDIDLWHKSFDHVKFPQLREMQTKNFVFGLPKISVWNSQVCEAHCEIVFRKLLDIEEYKVWSIHIWRTRTQTKILRISQTKSHGEK